MVCLNVEHKIPIVIIPNNLVHTSILHKEHRPLNLLYGNISNLLMENLEDKIHNKYLMFYNDNLHNDGLMELITKYKRDWELNSDKSYCLFIFTNSPIPYLEDKSNTDINYELFSYQSNLPSISISAN